MTEASDGFTVQFPYLPGGLDDFVDRVIPELQRRGLFRREYKGTTLRENLGLPRPENRFFGFFPRCPLPLFRRPRKFALGRRDEIRMTIAPPPGRGA